MSMKMYERKRACVLNEDMKVLRTEPKTMTLGQSSKGRVSVDAVGLERTKSDEDERGLKYTMKDDVVKGDVEDDVPNRMMERIPKEVKRLAKSPHHET